jgi:hypothetical protein
MPAAAVILTYVQVIAQFDFDFGKFAALTEFNGNFQNSLQTAAVSSKIIFSLPHAM